MITFYCEKHYINKCDDVKKHSRRPLTFSILIKKYVACKIFMHKFSRRIKAPGFL